MSMVEENVTMFDATVDEEGSLSPADQRTLKALLLRFVGKRITLKIQKYRERRSRQANNYYWAVVVEMMHQCSGHSKTECHNELRARFNMELVEFVNEQGEIASWMVPGRTRYMEPQQYADYVDQCEAWICEFFGVQFPAFGGDRYQQLDMD